MAIEASPSGSFYAVCTGFASGLTGTLGVRVVNDATSATVTARTTSGITENPASSGRYVYSGTAPSSAGKYSVVWDSGSVSPSTLADEQLIVYSDDSWISLKPPVHGL